VEVIECFFCVLDDSFFRWKRHRSSLNIRQTRSPVLKTQIGRIQTPLDSDFALVPYLPCGTKVAQRRRVPNQDFSQVIVPPCNVPKVPTDRLWSLRGTPSELDQRKLNDHREDCVMTCVVLPGDQPERLAGISL